MKAPIRWEIHVVADSDSRWKWGAALARRLVPDVDVRIETTLLHGRSTPNDRQLHDIGITTDALRRATVSELVAELTDTTARIVVLACIGGSVQAMLQALSRAWEGREDRPIVVTGYVGLVYERVVDGLLLRAGADIVLANSARDARRFREVLRAVDADGDSVVQTALPFLGGPKHDPHAAPRDRPFTTTFVSQPGVPESRDERRYALLQAIDHARINPSRRVIVKLRARPGERTTHVEPHHYASMIRARHLPPNVELAYGSMSDVLDQTDLCVTVSSTAAIEAMHRDIPTAVLTDFGIRESLGNHVFLGSGVLTSWGALHAGAIPKLDVEWAAANGVDDPAPYAAAASRIAELTNPAVSLPPLRPWLQVGNAAGYLPGLLSRHGVDDFGLPLSGRSAAGAVIPLHTRALRAAARRSYQVGVRTLEPRIKRLAGL